MQALTKINDNKIRMVLIPVFGILIPNLSGLFGHITFNSPYYWIGYVYFIFISFVIYQGNRFLLFKQREHFNWFRNPVRKLSLLIFANVFYTAPVTVILIIVWYKYADFNEVNWDVVEIVTLMNVIAVIFVTHVYETIFLIKERENDLLNFEKLQRAKAESELETLKNQIDPHFMFNSLNTLSYLIENDRIKALEFNDSLSDVYRYILMNKNKELVQLKDEVDFLNNYYSLLKLRFGNAIKLNYNLNSNHYYLIPPISLQLLLENAVKHNEFDEENPLTINFQINKSTIIVSNKINKKNNLANSSKVGLKNLSERFKLITEKDINVISSNGTFKVEIPLIKTEL